MFPKSVVLTYICHANNVVTGLHTGSTTLLVWT
jgi:hypothetical protein